MKFRNAFIGAVFTVAVTASLLLADFPSDDAIETYMLSTLFFMAGLGLFSWGFGTFKKLQFVRSTPTSKIRSMAQGNVEITGEAKQLNQNLESPFTGEECLFYSYKVEEYQKTNSKRRRRRWKTIDSGEEKIRFAVDDGTGLAVIEPEGSKVDLETSNTFTVSGRDTPPERVQNFIEQNDNVNEGSNELISLTDNRRRYTEEFLKPGTELYIFGYSDSKVIDGETFNLVKDGGVPLFYIADKSEEEIISNWSTSYKLKILAGLIISPVSYFIMLISAGII